MFPLFFRFYFHIGHYRVLIGFPRVISSIHSSAYLAWNWYLDRHLCCCLVAQLYLFVTLWTVAHQAPLSMGFSTQEYWSGLPFPSPGDILDPGKPGSPALQVILYCLSHQGNPPEIQQELNVFLLAQGLITEMKGIWDLFSNRIILGSSNRAGLHQCFTGSQDWTLIFSGCLLNEATPRFWVCVSEAALKPINLSRVF